MSEIPSTKKGGRRVGAGRKPGKTASAHQRYTVAKARKEEALADLRSMEVRVRAGQLIPAAEVAEAVTLAHAAVAQTLLSLPDTLERTAGLTSAQAEAAERVIHSAMNDLADRLAHLGPEVTAT